MEWYLGPLKKYLDFSGRASRKEYWLFFLWQLLIVFVLALISPIIYVLYVFGVFLPTLAVQVRRLHDTNRSGWWLLISVVPFVGAIVLLVFFCSEGTNGDNDYGPNPLVSVAAPPGPVETGPRPFPKTSPSAPSHTSGIRQSASSSDVSGVSPPPYQERPTIKMKPESIPETPSKSES